MPSIEWIRDVRKCRKAFHISNLVFWILGWGSLAVGIWLYIDRNTYAALAPSSYSAMSTAGLCISMGGMVLIIAFVGLVGAWIESKCLLVASTTGVMGHFYRDAVREKIKHGLYTTINRTSSSAALASYPNADNSFKLTWNQMQSKLRCCGVESYADWYYSTQWPRHKFVPDSCCDPTHFSAADNKAMANCGKSESNVALFFTEGCNEKFTNWLLHHLVVVGVLALLFVMVEVFVLATSLRLILHVHSKQKSSQNREPSCRYNKDGQGLQPERQSCLLDMIDNNT